MTNAVYWEKMTKAMDVLIAKGWTARQCWELVDKYTEREGFDEAHILAIVETMRIYI